MDKGYYFQKVSLIEDTELMINNQLYDKESHFQWISIEQDIIYSVSTPYSKRTLKR